MNRMKYQVMEGRYNFDENSADTMFATNNKQQAIQTVEDFGHGMVVVSVDEKGNKQRIFTAAYKTELGIKE